MSSRANPDRTVAENLLDKLHELAGHCGHCGAKGCPGKKSHSVLPGQIKTEHVLKAIEFATGESP